jgi:putative FmdB family regulatory protein
MPFYEYECASCKFYTEVMQKISDPPLEKCPSCGKKALKKLVSAPVFRLKGGGWYETDFKSDKENKRNLAGAEREESSPKSDETKPAKSDDAKPAPASAEPAAKSAGESRSAAKTGAGSASSGSSSRPSSGSSNRGSASSRSSKPASKGSARKPTVAAKSAGRKKGRR